MRRLRSFSLAHFLSGSLLTLLLLAGPTSTAESPRIYKWVDSNGIAHYTTDPERVPKALRDRIESVDRAPRERPVVTVEKPPMEVEASMEVEPPPTGAPQPVHPTLAEAPGSPADATEPVAIAPEAPAIRVPTASASESWVTRDALPRLRGGSSLLAEGEASPEQRDAIAAEQEVLDGQIAEVEAQIQREEDTLKDLITDPELDKETPLFDRPEFLELSRRLPQLQAQLEELRGQRQQLETP